MNIFSLIASAFYDLLLQNIPSFLIFSKQPYTYAFLVHPRDFGDIYRKYPFLKILPREGIKYFAKFFWPITVSEITGLVSIKDGQPVRGHVITIAMTAEQMLRDRSLALKRIKQAVTLASKKGARIVGLGALTASVTKGGLDLADNPEGVGITTGHAYTAFNITEYVRTLQEKFSLPKDKIKVGIVGAAGSVGSTCAKVLARDGFQNILLVDLKRKESRFDSLPEELKEINPKMQTSLSYDVADVQRCDFIITATNAPEAVIRSNHVQSGTVIIDDAQPSDIAPDVFNKSDVIVLEAGAVHTPHVTTNFNMGLQDRYDNFCCMAELLALAAEKWDRHYVLNRATLDLVDEVSEMGKKLGFRVAAFQNDRELISSKRLQEVGDIIRGRYAHAS